MLWDVLLDAVVDCLKDLPFLFGAFLLLELLEHHVSDKMNSALEHAGNWGPIAGALMGCVPQCGFSILSSELYAGRVISMGTLLAVYLSTSDEALVILLADPSRMPDIIRLIAIKVIIGIVAGYLILAGEKFWRKRFSNKNGESTDSIGLHDSHDEEHGILRPALQRTAEVMAFLFVITFLLNLLIEGIGLDRLSKLLLAESPMQPFLAALIGMIPNCASSVILTELFMDEVISFGSMVAGLCSAAGLGLIVLFRVNPRKKENFVIVGLLLAAAILAGLVLQAAVG